VALIQSPLFPLTQNTTWFSLSPFSPIAPTENRLRTSFCFKLFAFTSFLFHLFVRPAMTITSRPPNLPLFATFLLIFLRCVHCTANTTQLRWTTLERQVFSFSNDSDGTTTLLQNNTRSIVSSWDLDRNGLISRDEFNQAMSHSLISEDRSWFRRLWDKFRSHRQTQNLDILWWSIVQKPQSNYTQQGMFLIS
jgi:hypothetical protein